MIDQYRGGGRWTPEDLLRKLATQRKVSSAFELCCKLRSLGWVITTLSGVKRREREQMAQIKRSLEGESQKKVKVWQARLRDENTKAEQKETALLEARGRPMEEFPSPSMPCDICERTVAAGTLMHGTKLKKKEQDSDSVPDLDEPIAWQHAICAECHSQCQSSDRTAELAHSFVNDIVHALSKDVRPAQAAEQILNLLSESRNKQNLHKIKNANLARLSAIAAVFVIEQLSGTMSIGGSTNRNPGIGLRADDVCRVVMECAGNVYDEGQASQSGCTMIWEVEKAVCSEFEVRAFTALGQGTFLQFLASEQGAVCGTRLLQSLRQGSGEHTSEENDSGFDSFRTGARSVDEASVLQWVEQEILTSGVNELEERVCDKFDLPTFSAAGVGSLFGFITHHPSIGQLIASRLGWHSSSGAVLQSGDVAEFVRQCCENAAETLTAAELDACFLQHFGGSLQDLQQSDAATLLAVQSSDSGGDSIVPSTRVLFMGAISNNNSDGSVVSGDINPTDTVGQCGHVSRAQLIQSLLQAPMVTPLESHLMWESTFEPQYRGGLRSFLHSCGDDELPPGKFC
eukprot:SAG22_NODE_1112_length_5535_cov_11.367918_5_plen_571_part_01